MPTASDPWSGDEPPHVPWRTDHGPLPQVCLTPGDPDRVALYGQVMDDFTILGQRREYVLARGSVAGVPIAVCSTGIGGPSTEIALVELARLGVRTVIRTGGMGSITADVPSGEIVVVDRAHTFASGTARAYEAAPLVHATPKVVTALRQSLAEQGEGTAAPASVVSADSYYVGEGRAVPGLEAVAERRYAEILETDAVGIDMEAATILAVGPAVGLDVGGILVAHGNRVDDSWVVHYESRQLAMMAAACRAAAALVERTDR